MPSVPRVIAYHQTHGHGDDFVPLASIGREADLTHLLIAAVHIADDATIILNDHPHDDPYHDRLWREVEAVRDRGIPVMAMVGGWAPGTTEKLDGEAFDTYYPALRNFLRRHHFDGIDIDVEQDMSLDGVVRLIDTIRADFGEEFIIVLAPTASAMWGGANLSGFDYRDLERTRKEAIDFYLVQFYSGFARADDIDAYERVVAEGVFDRDRIVLGMIGTDEDSSFIPLENVAEAVTHLAATHPDFGGVDVWEFPHHGGHPDVAWWATLMREALDAGRSRLAERPEPVLGLVPRPDEVHVTGETIVLPRELRADGPAGWVDVVTDLLGAGTGIRVRSSGGAANLRIECADTTPGGYRLRVNEQGIVIVAGDDEGLANAISTLHQLLPDWTNGPAPLPGATLEMPCVEIADSPAYRWRGMHLDVGRHMAPLPFLYRFVDLLAMHKFNVFHLHLTDDQGWRFEVKSWPRLTTIGAMRPETRFPHWEVGDGVPHGGYYTQEQLRALVGYASRRGVVIVPEIDVPGHVRAVLAAYPELGDGTSDEGVATTFGVFGDVLHLSEATVSMVEDVFGELCEVFDSPWIHIGGDECPTDQWEASDDSARLASERGLNGPASLQPWLTTRLRAFLAARGRRLVGWDEIIEHEGDPADVVMSWRGHEPGVRALAEGHEVVMAPGHTTYFDHYQSPSDKERHCIGGLTTWQDVARWDPRDGIAAEDLSRLLGVQGQLWSEYLVDAARVEYQMFPRAAALAEVAWNGRADVADLEPRLRRHLGRLDAAAVNYRPLEGPRPWQAGGTGRYSRGDEHGRHHA